MPKEPVSNTMVSAIQLMKFLLNFGWKNYFNVNDLRRFAMPLKQQQRKKGLKNSGPNRTRTQTSVIQLQCRGQVSSSNEA